MRRPPAMILLLALLAMSSALAGPALWRPAPHEYSFEGNAVVASDGGGSTADQYLLTTRQYTDFVLSLDITRLKAGGDRLRAIIVWGIDPRAPGNRGSFFIPVNRLAEGETHRVQVVKLGDRVALKMDGAVISRSPSMYGSPLEAAPVGLLHYYNYHFRYDNLQITPLDPKALPQPDSLAATVTPSGVVHLAWDVPEQYQGLVGFSVRRWQGGASDRPPTQEELLSTDETSAGDVTGRTHATYSYAVAATSGRGAGPMSAPVTVRLEPSRPPARVARLKAVRRIDGSTRLSWDHPTDSRRAGYRVRCGSQIIAQALPPSATTYLAEPSNLRSYTVETLDPDGKRHAAFRVRAEPSAPLVRPRAPWPGRHPYLRLSADDIDTVREAAQTDETVQRLLRDARATADGAIRLPPAVPAEPSDKHRDLPGPLRTVAQAYALTGDDKYAAWVRQAMLAYADLYPTLEPHGGGRARIVGTDSGLYEATWYVPVICAYDMTYDSPAYSVEDHQRIARDLLRPAAELFWVRNYDDATDYRATDLHYKCYNFQAWFISAVGLTGLLLQDADMVEHAIDGPYGLKHLLKHDIHDDGLFWERSLGYHSFVLSALLPFLEAAWHCNIDLWHLAVPDDYNQDREPLANYTVGDGDNGPKSIKLMLDAPFYSIFGDRSYANIGDSNSGPLRASDYYRAAYRRLRDPAYAWLCRPTRADPGRRPLYTGDSDLSGSVRMAYNDQFLYIAARVTDDTVRNTWRAPQDVWRGDLLWVGLKWTEGGPNAYDFIYGLSPGDFGNVEPVPAVFNRFQAVAHARSAGEYAVAKTSKGYDLELAIPWSEFEPREGETGNALRPADADNIRIELVLYDGDPAGDTSSKDKMLAWQSTTDRYDTGQGGTLVWGSRNSDAAGIISAPLVETLAMDGDLSDWASLPATQAHIGASSSLTTDASTAGTGLLDLIYQIPAGSHGNPDLRKSSFCNNGVLQAGCSLYPSSGLAVLRERLDARGLPPVDATCCTLNYGPHGGGHGHSDQLSIVVYADGKQWIPDFGSCAYGSTEKQTWTAQTISHNTVTTDETSQLPTGTGTPSWPCDSAAAQVRGFLDLLQCTPAWKIARARNTAVYEGVALRRTAVVVGHSVVDFFEVTGDEQHRYDYALHIDGPLLESSVGLTPQEGVLADKPGYRHISKVKRGQTARAVVTQWGNQSRRLQISASPVPGTQIITAESITNSLDRRMPMLMLRRDATSTTFAVVMQPYTDTEPEAPTWLQGDEGVIGVRVPTANGPALVVLNAGGHPVELDGLRVDDAVGVRVMPPPTPMVLGLN